MVMFHFSKMLWICKASSCSVCEEVPPCFFTYLRAVMLSVNSLMCESLTFSACRLMANRIVFSSRTFMLVSFSSVDQCPDVVSSSDVIPQPESDASVKIVALGVSLVRFIICMGRPFILWASSSHHCNSCRLSFERGHRFSHRCEPRSKFWARSL